MEPLQLFDIAAKQSRWLSVSQSVIAGNVSNANTPGYQAQTVQPFDTVFDQTGLQLASTNANHLSAGNADQKAVGVKAEDSPWEVTESGNSVSLEGELIKAGEVNRSFALNTSIVKAFHGMLMASLRSGS